MIRWFMLFLAMAFPWLIILLDDNPGGALIALAMQATIVGWLPASIWAIRVVNETYKKVEKTNKKKKA